MTRRPKAVVSAILVGTVAAILDGLVSPPVLATVAAGRSRISQPATGAAQSELERREARRAKALQNLPPIAIVIQPSMRVEKVTVTEAADIVQADVNRALPDFQIVRNVEGARAWMELGIVTAPEGGMVELAVYRWVRIEGINDDVFTKVWSESRLVLRGVNRTILREAIDSLVTTFAADYLRAKKDN